MFDVLNKVTVDAIISPYHIGERDLLHGLLTVFFENSYNLLNIKHKKMDIPKMN
jgi:hypothetical protein